MTCPYPLDVLTNPAVRRLDDEATALLESYLSPAEQLVNAHRDQLNDIVEQLARIEPGDNLDGARSDLMAGLSRSLLELRRTARNLAYDVNAEQARQERETAS